MRVTRIKLNAIRVLDPVSLDKLDKRITDYAGRKVRVIEPGPIGHVYVEDARTRVFIGLVANESLKEG